VSVQVKLDDEAGAAGLVFGSDGADRHYGFYPSGGQLRLTRFEGPNVFSWNILRQVPSPHYQRGAWNQLRVQVGTNAIRCFVNGELVCEAPADELAGRAVGLAKFRDTRAEFRGFRAGPAVGTGNGAASPEGSGLPAALARRLGVWAEGAPDASDAATNGLVTALQPHAEAARAELSERARRMERQAGALRRMAGELHREDVRSRLVAALDGPEAGIDLVHAALLVARHDDPELDVEGYRVQMRALARELEESLPAGADNEAKLRALRDFLFTRNGFHGSRSDYHNRANSYINRVLDDREGLPITLSVLFLELARAIGLEGVAGAPLPGHFMVRYAPREGALQLIDVFDGGRIITRSEAQERVLEATGEGFREEHLEPASKRDIIVRMLRNLQNNAERAGESLTALHYADLLVSVSSPGTVAGERLTRVRLRLQRGEAAGAKADLKWILDQQPTGIDLERVAELYRSLDAKE
jgi:regulator of sirC expression with transglutaminase-like and TPR domain